MKDQIQIFKTVIRAVDAIKGTVCIKGMYADETINLSISSLIPYFARDIFLLQKDVPLLKTRTDFKIIAGIKWPCIEISLPDGMNEEDFTEIKSHLIQMMWNYNFITYDAKDDRYKQRFSYAFNFRSACDSVKAA